jgi:hypothetical protein
MFNGNIYIIQREKQLIIIFTFLTSDYSFFRKWPFNPTTGKQNFSIVLAIMKNAIKLGKSVI